MAVSGSKVPDFQSSISKSSAEHFDHECDPCLTTGQHFEAAGFCVNCSEYLCKPCYSSHQKTKASRHHQLLDKNNIGNQTTTPKVFKVPTEKCSSHSSEVIKFFCPQHKALGCHDCITLDHRTCKVDYIPDICADIGDSDEYKGTMWLLNQKLKEIDTVMKKAAVRDKEIDNCHDNLVQEIAKFRKEINNRLDQLQKVIETEADRKKSADKQVIKEVLQACTDISANIDKLQCSISTSNNSKQNGQLYINIKQAHSKLKSDEVKMAEEGLEKINRQYVFERKEDLINMLSNQNMFGKLRSSDTLAVPRKKTFNTLTHKKDIGVKTKSDRLFCRISGCAVLSSYKLVLVDNQNNKLKIVDIQSKAVIEEKKLSPDTFDIAVMPNDQIAVTLPSQRQIIIMKADSNLSTVHKIEIKGRCHGITYHQDHLYVVCQDPNSVLVLDTQGNVQYTISLNNEMFKRPEYIVVGEDCRHIYISDFDSNSVVSITLQGDVSAVYKHKDLIEPRGMLMLDDGSLLVCSCWNGTIHHISGDLQQGQKVIDNARRPYSICYSNQHDEVYIGGRNDKLKRKVSNRS